MESSLDRLSYETIGACIEVHSHLGPCLLESAYEEAVLHELHLRGLSCERQVTFPARYKELVLPVSYRIDILVERQIVLELKTVERLLPVHAAQILTYLRVGQLPLGLLINFNSATLRGQIQRYVRSAAL
ncbi:MAG TPA: GxxExxY protein [Labilithrix sp.]|nr:GxxExxY protein [Labilithrix sp.]